MLILASGSAIRRQLLQEAGVPITTHPVAVDEDALRHHAEQEGPSLRETALTLARAKARAASSAFPHHYILAADQLLDLEGTAFAKARTMEEARSHLLTLRGKTHALHTALTLWKDGQESWAHSESPRLTMRSFSPAFLDAYLHKEGTALLACVGCYRIEGMGIQLFHLIEGGHDAIAGLPLLPLLHALRERNLLPS